MALALIVHGGAGMIPADRHAAASEGCRAAVEAGWRALLAGGSALDAVQTAIMALEDNPGFNAGVGGVLTLDGRGGRRAAHQESDPAGAGCAGQPACAAGRRGG